MQRSNLDDDYIRSHFMLLSDHAKVMRKDDRDAAAQLYQDAFNVFITIKTKTVDDYRKAAEKLMALQIIILTMKNMHKQSKATKMESSISFLLRN